MQQQRSLTSPLKAPLTPYARPLGSAPDPLMVSPHAAHVPSPHNNQISPQHRMYSPNPGSVAMSPNPRMSHYSQPLSNSMGPPSVGPPPGYPQQMAQPFSPDGRNSGPLTPHPQDIMNNALTM